VAPVAVAQHHIHLLQRQLGGAAHLVATTAIGDSQLRFALTSLQRRPGATVVQVVSLSLGLMALLLLTVVRADLMSAWRSATPTFRSPASIFPSAYFPAPKTVQTSAA